MHPATLFSQEVLSDDMFGAFFAIAMLIVAAMTTVGSFNYMRKHGHHAVYYSLILMSAVGMVLVAYSADLVMLFVAWELMSIPTYALAAFAKREPIIKRGGHKIFLVWSIGFSDNRLCYIFGIRNYWLYKHCRGHTGIFKFGFLHVAVGSSLYCPLYSWIWIQDGPGTVSHVASRYVRGSTCSSSALLAASKLSPFNGTFYV